jgi:outer membrane PBP1 activator LpoA protein
MAHEDGRRSALILSDTLPLARRIQKAFADEFARMGGSVTADFIFRANTADLLALREATSSGQSDMAFLCVDNKRARVARAYIDNRLAVYATSQVLEGVPDRMRDADLDGVRFVAMPWLLQADHPAVMAYARTPNALPAATDFERLYAFGIDAYRIAADLLRSRDVAHTALDGVTGRISLGAGRHFARELTAAQFVDGQPVPVSRP